MSHIAGRVVDYYDDPQFFKTAEAIDLVRTGRLVDSYDAGTLPDSAFALKLASRRTHRYFPVHSKEAALISAHYWEKADFLSDKARDVAAQNLKLAFDRFGLKQPAALGAVKTAEVSSNLVVDRPAPDADAPEIEKTADAILAAIGTFMARDAQLTPDNRCLYASTIVKEASLAGMLDAIPRRVMDYAAKPHVSPWITTKLAERRAVVRAQDGDLVSFDHLADRVRKTASVSKAVELLERVDRAFNLVGQYGHRVADPYLSVFGGVKVAAAITSGWGDETDPKIHALRSIAYEEDALRRLFGDNYAHKFQRNPIDCYNASTGKLRTMLDAMLKELTDSKDKGALPIGDSPLGAATEARNAIDSIGPKQRSPSMVIGATG